VTERQLAVMSEALRTLAREDEFTAAQLERAGRIMALQTVLADPDGEVEHRVVWEIIETDLPALLLQVEVLLGRS